MLPPNLKYLTFGLLAVLSAGFLASAAPAQVATQLPDEIDAPRHRALAADARKKADSARAEANGLKAKADGLTAEAAGLTQQRRELVQSLETKKATLARQEAENPRLAETNRALVADIVASRNELAANARTLDPLSQNLRTLTAEVAREQAAFDSLNGRLAQIDRDLQGANGNVVERERALLLGQLNLRQAIENRNSAAIDFNRTNSEIESLRVAIAERQRDLRQTDAEIPVLAQRVATAEAAQRQKEQQVVPLRQRLAESRQPVEEARRQLQPIQKQISELQAEIKKLDDGIAGLRARISALDRDIPATQARERETRDGLAASESRLQTLIAAAGMDAWRASIDAKIKANDETISNLMLTAKQQAVAARLKALRDENDDLREQLASNSPTPEIAALRKRIPELKTTADQLSATLAARQTERAGIAPDLDRRTAQRQMLQADLDRTQPRLVEAQRHVSEAEARIAPIQRDLDRETAVLDQLTRDLGRDRRAVEVNAQQRRELADRLNDLNRRRGQSDVRMSQLATEINSLDRQIPGLDSWIASATAQLSNDRAQALVFATARGATAASATTQGRTVGVLQQQYAEVDGRAQALSARNRDLSARISQSEAQIEGNTLQISRNTASIETLRKEIPQVSSSISLIDLRIPLADRAAVTATDVFRASDAGAVRSEQTAAVADARYGEVLKAYNERRDGARLVGEQQGRLQGEAAGRPKGMVDGQVAGAQSGEQAGYAEGLAASFARGADEGVQKGDAAGYAKGNSLENIEEGRKAGLAQGEREAWDEAKRVDNPRGHAVRRTELLSARPANSVVIDNGLPVSLIPTGIAPSPQAVVGAAPSAVDPQAVTRASPVAVARQGVTSGGLVRPVSQSSIAVPSPTVPQGSSPDCQMGHVDFISACQDGFKAGLKSSYEETYAMAFRAAYQTSFEAARKKVYDASLSTRYQEGFDSAYPGAYAAAEKRGADDARSKGAEESRREAFERTIAKAREEEFQRGKEAEFAFFAANPVLRFERAALVELAPESEAGDLVPGDNFALEITLSNFGGAPTAPGAAHVQWKALTSSADIPDEEAYLAAIPPGSTAVIRRAVVGQVTRGSAGSAIDTQMVVTLPDGSIQELRLSAPVVADLPMSIERVSTETNPKVGKSYDLNVRLKNTAQQSTFEDVRVVVTTDSSAVRIEKGEDKVKKLKPQDSAEGKLQYKVMSPVASGEQIVLKITAFHGRNVSARTTVTVVPAR